jgi:hypothetical protein
LRTEVQLDLDVALWRNSTTSPSRSGSAVGFLDELIVLLTCRFGTDAKRPQGLDRHPIVVPEKAEQEMLDADQLSITTPLADQACCLTRIGQAVR